MLKHKKGMKHKLATFLVKLANYICPTYEVKPSYEAKEIAIAVAIKKKHIRLYRESCRKKASYRKAIADIIRIQKGNNRSHIFEAIERKSLIKDSVYQRGSDTIVESRLKVYVRKENK